MKLLALLIVSTLVGCTTNPTEFNQKTKPSNKHKQVIKKNYQVVYRNISKGFRVCSPAGLNRLVGGSPEIEKDIYHDIKKGYFNISPSGSFGFSGPGIIVTTINIKAVSKQSSEMVIRSQETVFANDTLMKQKVKKYTNWAKRNYICD